MNASRLRGIEPERTATPKVSIPGAERSFFQSPDDPSLLQAALRAGLPFPYECSSGGCGTCRIKITRGTFESLWAVAPGLSESHRRRGFALACQTRATSDLDIAVTLGAFQDEWVRPHRRPATLVDVEQLTRDMRLFRFRANGRAAVVSERNDPLCGGWSGSTGFVHEEVARRIGSAAQEREIYFAGPPPMAEALQRTLMLDLKVPFQQIHFDRFF